MTVDVMRRTAPGQPCDRAGRGGRGRAEERDAADAQRLAAGDSAREPARERVEPAVEGAIHDPGYRH